MKRTSSHKILLYIFCSLILLTGSFVTGNTDAEFTYLTGTASWYSEFSPGIRETTANMELFDHDMMTCAMWGVPFDTLLEVTNLDNDRRVIVRVNDRGPARRLVKKGRVIDLTMRAFEEIEDLDKGLTSVKIRVVGRREQSF